MTGLLSQALANLQAAENQIAAVPGLPPQAVAVQQDSQAKIGLTATLVTQLQSTTQAFVADMTPRLANVMTQLQGSTPLSEITPELTAIQQSSSEVHTGVVAVADQIMALKVTVDGYDAQLAAVTNTLAGQMAGLQAKLGTARDNAAAASKKYYWLIALGPFGLIGLAAALAAYEVIRTEVAGYEQQASAAQAQIARLQAMVVATRQLMADFGDVGMKTQDVVNALEFLGNDIMQLVTDTSTGTSRPQLILFAQAAQTELATVGSEAG